MVAASDLILSFSSSTTVPIRNTVSGATITSTAAIGTAQKLAAQYSGSLVCVADATKSTRLVLTTAPPTAAPGWTYEFWFYGTNYDDQRRQLTLHNINNSQGVQLQTGPSLNHYINFDGDNYATAWWTLPASPYGAWHHYAFVNDGTQFRCYQDGLLVGSGLPKLLQMGTTLTINATRSGVAMCAEGAMNDFCFTLGSTKYTGTRFTLPFPLVVPRPSSALALLPAPLYTAGPPTSIGALVYSLQLNTQTTGSSGQFAYVTPVPAVGGSFTIECWFVMQRIAANVRIFDISTGNGTNQIVIYVDNTGLLRFNSTSPGNDYPSGYGPKTDTLTHLAVTVSGTVLKWYINGALVSTVTGLTAIPATVRNTAQWGRSSYGESTANPLFRGTLADMRLWSVARSPLQITAAYQSVLTGREAGLVFVFGSQALSAQTSVINNEGPLPYSMTLVNFSIASSLIVGPFGSVVTPSVSVADNAAGCVDYSWTTSAGATQKLPASADGLSNLLSGTYTVTATDTLGRTGTYTYTVHAWNEAILARDAANKIVVDTLKAANMNSLLQPVPSFTSLNFKVTLPSSLVSSTTAAAKYTWQLQAIEDSPTTTGWKVGPFITPSSAVVPVQISGLAPGVAYSVNFIVKVMVITTAAGAEAENTIFISNFKVATLPASALTSSVDVGSNSMMITYSIPAAVPAGLTLFVGPTALQDVSGDGTVTVNNLQQGTDYTITFKE